MNIIPRSRNEALRWLLLATAATTLPTLALGYTARTPSQRRIMLASGFGLHLAVGVLLFFLPIESLYLTQGVLLTLTWFVALAAGMGIRVASEHTDPQTAATTSAAALAGAAICFFAFMTSTNAARLQAEMAGQAERHVAALAATFERATATMSDAARSKIREELFLPAALKILRPEAPEPAPRPSISQGG